MDRYRTGANMATAHSQRLTPPKSILTKTDSPRKPSVARVVSFGQGVVNDDVESMLAPQLLSSISARFGEGCVVSTNFGPNSAVILHLASRANPDIPIVFVDTGYLSEETYKYAESLTTLLKLNLKVYQPHMSRARMEAIHGNLWETDEKEFGRLRKIEPMKRALSELKVKATVVGLRRSQLSKAASSLVVPRVSKDGNERFRVLPIFDWSDADMARYTQEHGLPSHGASSSGPRCDALQFTEHDASLCVNKPQTVRQAKTLSPLLVAIPGSSEKTFSSSVADNIEVELYTKLNSALCVSTKKLLEDKGVGFTEYIVDVDIAEDELVASVGGGANKTIPFVFINGDYVGGFNELCERMNEDPRRHVGVWGRAMAPVQVGMV